MKTIRTKFYEDNSSITLDYNYDQQSNCNFMKMNPKKLAINQNLYHIIQHRHHFSAFQGKGASKGQKHIVEYEETKEITRT